MQVRSSFTMVLMIAAVAVAQTRTDDSKWPTAGDGDCEFHPIPFRSVALVATIPDASRNLKSDGRGRYWEGSDTVRSYTNAFYMLFAYWPETCNLPRPQRVRLIQFRLNEPESGAKSWGIIDDPDGMLYIVPPGDRVRKAGMDPPLYRMQVGQTAPSPRSLLRFHRDGKIYYLRMGTERFEPPLPNYVELLPGTGSTSAQITRTAEHKWVIQAPIGSLARLSQWGKDPVDLGLYRFSFEIQLETQRRNMN
jgi:hypothetical protein